MKRILSLLLVALMIFGLLPTNAITASAAETTVTLTVTGSTGTKSSDSSSISWTSDGVTFTNVKGSTAIRTSDSNHYRIYAGSSATISAPGNITKIVVTCTSSSYATVFKNSVGSEVTVSGSAVTIIPTASSTSYSISNFTAQTRISAVAVTYAEATPSCEHTNTTENSDGYAATCTETGMTNSVTCNDCGETVTAQKVIPALGHSYVDGVCQNCGNKLPVVSFSVPSQVDGVDSIIANESGVVTLPSAATTYTGKYAYTFVGWTTGTVSDTETEPTLYTANSAYTPAENTTLYAVYTYDIEGEGSTGTATEYELYSGDLTEGDYLIVYESSAMNTTVSSSRLMFDTVTATNNVISNPAADIIWHIAPDGDYWTIYNTEKGAYAASTGAKNKATVDTSITDNARWTVSGTSTYEFINKANAASSVNANLRKNGTYGFACYSTSTGGALSLYKAVTSSGTTLTTFYTTTLEDLDTTCQHPNTTETTVNASCTEDGKTTVTCDDCGAVISTEVIEATGHSYNSVVTDPTCTAAGYITYTCSVCGNSYTDSATEALGHSYESVTSGLTTTYTCTVCGDTYSETAEAEVEYVLVTDASTLQVGDKIVIVAQNANYAMSTTQSNNNRGQVEVTKNTSDNTVEITDDVQVITLENGNVSGSFAFYTEEGYLYAASSGSNYLRTKADLDDNGSWLITIAADGTATIKAQGTNTRNWLRYNSTSSIFSCYGSGQGDVAIYKETVVCEHSNIVDVAEVPATCTSVGYTAGKQCSDCGEYTEGHEEIPMIDHSYGEGVQTTAPDCVNTGVMTYTCTVCGHSYTEEIPANGHEMGEGVVVDATCTTDGSKTYNCTVCGEKQVETIDALGHSWGDWTETTAPTCTEAGVKMRTCSRCNETETQAVDALGHNWDEGNITIAATCEDAGVKTYTCSVCGDTKTESIPATGHTYDANGVCSCGSKISHFKLVNEYTEILAGGEFVIALKSGSTYYAVSNVVGSSLAPVDITDYIVGSGADTMVKYDETVPIWKIDYYQNRNDCFSLYSPVSSKYLTGTTTSSFGSDTVPGAWTFVDKAGVAEIDDDGNATGAIAYEVIYATNVDRGIAYHSSKFGNYSVRGGYPMELYFFELVDADATAYTVSFSENGSKNITESVSVSSNVLDMPESTGAPMPSGYTSFIGWVALPHTESLIAPTTIYKPGDSVVITDDTTFYALYTREDPDAEGQAMSYHLVTDNNQLVIGQKYIIVGYYPNEGYYAMSQDQLSTDRGASPVTPDENGVITFDPDDNVAAFELEQGYEIGSFAFLDLAMNKFLYCDSSTSENTLLSQSTLNSAGSFIITINSEAEGYYSTVISQIDTATTTRTHLMFNTTHNTDRFFSCYDYDATQMEKANTFLYVGVPNTVAATYYTTGLCEHNWVETETVAASCEHAGYTIETCSICGEVQVTDTQAHGHTVGNSTVTTAPTCTTTGIATSYCTACNKEFTEILPVIDHTPVVDAAVAATCTETGLTEGSHCSVCNNIITAQAVVPALGHDYETPYVNETDYFATSHFIDAENKEEKACPTIVEDCSRCSDKHIIAQLKFMGATPVLENTLILNYSVSEDVLGDGKGFTDVTATFEYGERVGDTLAVPASLDENNKNSEGRYILPCSKITPSQIGDEITATITGDYEEKSYSFTLTGYSVAQYCYNTLKNTDSTAAANAELRTLLVDLLYYCDAARAYTTYKADVSVTNALSEEYKALRSDVPADLQTVLNPKYAVIDDPSVSWKAAGLGLYHATAMRLRFKADSKENLTVKFEIDGESHYVSTIEDAEGYDGQYSVTFSGISGFQMRDTVLATVYDGNMQVSNTLSYSVESYAYAKKNDPNEDLANLVKAMICYGASASAYANR